MKSIATILLGVVIGPLGYLNVHAATPKIVASMNATLVQGGDGTLWGWGSGISGLSVRDTTTQNGTPRPITALSNVADIANGVVRMTDGSVWVLTRHSYQDFNNRQVVSDACTTEPLPEMPCAMAGLSGVTSIAGGASYFASVKSDGSVWGWGDNYGAGTIGNGITPVSGTPAAVPGLTGITSVAIGNGHALALKNDGTVWGWGYNIYGQLGTAASGAKLPTMVEGLTEVTAIAAGGYQSLALKKDGTIWAWGSNGVSAATPVAQKVELVRVVAISAGDDHALALDQEGNVWAWGRNDFGQLGKGDKSDSTGPVRVAGISGVVAISAGSTLSAAILNDGRVWVWGKVAWPLVATTDQCEFTYADTHGISATGQAIHYTEPCAKLPRQVIDADGKPFTAIATSTTNQSTGTTPTLSDDERVFNYLESVYPEHLPSRGTACSASGLVCRYYVERKAYLGTLLGRIYYLGPASEQRIMDVGSIADWLAKAQNAGK